MESKLGTGSNSKLTQNNEILKYLRMNHKPQLFVNEEDWKVHEPKYSET